MAVKKVKKTDSYTLAKWAVEGARNKKGKQIALINLTNFPNAVTDYFIVCTGTSDSHCDALADSIEESIFKATGEKPKSREGKSFKEWILVDYINIVIHVFKADARSFYGLEELWGDAPIEHFNDLD